ncbi:glycosyltransferase [Neobacillus drentensis]|uniref:glycosyltransferase n=1 Tax=Neobacillus drentensis TaxID=220684 RepID=UPI002FFE8B5E
MKTLLINAVSGYGSTGRTVIEIANKLNDNGHEGFIAYSEGVLEKNGWQIGTTFEKKLHGLFSRLTGKQGYYSTKGTEELIGYIESIDPDIIHLSNLHANYINLNLLLSYISKKDIPTVITLHDCWFYTGKCCHYTIDNCFKWQTECGNCPRLKKDNISWFLDRTTKMFNDKKTSFENISRLAVVGVSDWITNEAKKSFLSSAKVIKRIYNWVDIDIFKPIETTEVRKRLDLEGNYVILGVASKWNNEKGLNQFLELGKMLPSKHKIVLVGKIEDGINLPNNIINIPETQNISELVEYYSMADVFVTLSLEETFGKVIAEALACGTPAIVYNSTACPEVVGEDCGFVVDKNNLKAILEKLLEIEKNTKKYYSKNCVDHVKKNFNKDERLADYFNLYKELVEM